MLKETEHMTNGIKYYACTDGTKRRFCMTLYIRAGSAFEAENENGITHLFEHAVFRNIKRKFGGELYGKMLPFDLYFNGSTYNEFLSFTLMGVPESFPLACGILKYIFDDIDVTADEFNAEKGRIKSEIREDDDRTSIRYFADCAVWEGTPLSQTICGSCTSVGRISQKRLNEYKKRIMTCGNLFVYITGNAGKKEFDLLDKTLGSVNVQSGGIVNENTVPVPADFGKRPQRILIKSGSYTKVRLSFDVDSTRFPDGVRDILYSVLFKSDASLIYLAISENDPYVYSFDSRFEEYDNVSVLKLEYEVAERHFANSVKAVFGVFEKIKNGDFDFDGFKQNRITSLISDCDDIDELNFGLAYSNHILAGSRLDFERRDLGRYEQVTKQSVIEMAKAVFKKDNLVFAVKGNKKHIEKVNPEDLFGLLSGDFSDNI